MHLSDNWPFVPGVIELKNQDFMSPKSEGYKDFLIFNFYE